MSSKRRAVRIREQTEDIRVLVKTMYDVLEAAGEESGCSEDVNPENIDMLKTKLMYIAAKHANAVVCDADGKPAGSDPEHGEGENNCIAVDNKDQDSPNQGTDAGYYGEHKVFWPFGSSLASINPFKHEKLQLSSECNTTSQPTRSNKGERSSCCPFASRTKPSSNPVDFPQLPQAPKSMLAHLFQVCVVDNIRKGFHGLMFFGTLGYFLYWAKTLEPVLSEYKLPTYLSGVCGVVCVLVLVVLYFLFSDRMMGRPSGQTRRTPSEADAVED